MKLTLGPKTIIFPTPAWCIGTYDADGKPNIMTIAWGGICCSKPPCINFSLRKATYTYDAVLQKKAFTVNVPSKKYIAETDYFGMVSGRDTDKFGETEITPVRSEVVDAPYAEEFPLVLECRLNHHHEIGLHTIFIGEIIDVKCDEAMLSEEGQPDILKIQPIVYNPAGAQYFTLGEIAGQAFHIGKNRR